MDLSIFAPAIAGREYTVSGYVQAVAMADPNNQQAFGQYSALSVTVSGSIQSFQPNNGITIIGSTIFQQFSGSIYYVGGSPGSNELALMGFYIQVTRTA